MKIDIYHHVVDDGHDGPDGNWSKLFRTLNDLESKLDRVLRKEEAMGAELDALKKNVTDLVADVTAQGTVVDSAVTLLNGLTGQVATLQQQLADAIAAGDPVQIQAAADAIAQQNQLVIAATAKLAAAVPAGTPAA